MASLPNNAGIIFLLVFGLLQIVFGLVLGKILLKFATNLGVRNHGEGMIRWTATTKPSLGGIIFFFSFLLSIVFFLVILSENSKFNNLEFLGMVLCCTLGFIMGLADDAYNTKPWLKFSVQILCGVISVLCGNHVNIFSIQWINYFITVFWFVGIMNSLNMLDNMDSITSGVVSVACLFLLIFNIFNNHVFVYDTVLLLGVFSSLIAFLCYNWHPSKMYMGDSGSQFIGAFMAFVALKLLWNVSMNTSSLTTDYFMFILPVSFFIITISDTTTVSINRLLKGKSPFIGGKDHTTHHLVYAGLKQRSVAMLYIAISFLICLVAFLIYYYQFYTNISILVGFSTLLLIIFISLYIVTRKYKSDAKESN